MQFIKYTAAGCLIAAVAAPEAIACGPYWDQIPTPSYMMPRCKYNVGYSRKVENLEQWRQLTSADIPLADIDSVVYKAPLKAFLDSVKAPDTPASNRFYSYLRNTHDSEAVEFLTLAKELETYRAELSSPWYYPSSRQFKTEADALGGFADRCVAYSGTRLRDRYGLQAVRAIFALRDYEKCLEIYDTFFAELPNDNLFKRMSLDYVNGSLTNLGDSRESDRYFDLAGDIESIKDKKGMLFSYYDIQYLNANAPGWIHYVRREIENLDSVRLYNAAQTITQRRDIVNKGDWHYVMAYIAGEKFKDNERAKRHLDQALKEKFYMEEFHDLAVAYRLKISGFLDDRSTLLDDLRTLENRVDGKSSDSHFWSRILRNAIYTAWVPTLWDKGELTDMALLCNYADNLEETRDSETYYYYPYHEEILYGTYPTTWTGIAATAFEREQFGHLSFRLLESLKAKDLVRIAAELQKSTPLYRYLKRYSGLSSDFLNELTGTLALREGNYRMAANYLSRVSDRYLTGMRIYDENYLRRNPFYLSDERVAYCDAANRPAFKNLAVDSRYVEGNTPDAKLKFARRMLGLENIIATTPSADVKAMAQLLYASGHYESFNRCWALTQYWKGEYCGIFYPYINKGGRDFELPDGQCFTRLYDFDNCSQNNYVQSLYTARLYELLNSDASDEVKSQILYLTHSEGDVIRYYGNTPLASHIRTHCDQAADWKL